MYIGDYSMLAIVIPKSMHRLTLLAFSISAYTDSLSILLIETCNQPDE